MFDETLEEYKGVLDRDPDYLKVLLNMGNLYVQLGDTGQAIKLFKRVITLYPDIAEAWNPLSFVNKKLGNYDEATAAFKRLLLLNPFQEEAYMELAATQYSLYHSKPDGVKKEEIIQRLDFIMSINLHTQKGQKLLKEMTRDRKIQDRGSSG